MLVKWAFALVVIVFVTVAVRRQLADADFEGLQVRPTWLALSVLALPWMYLSIAWSERSLVASLTGRRLTMRQLLPAAWIPLLGKYVPGKVAAAGTAVVLLRRLGIPGSVAVGVFLLLDAMPVLTGTILGAALLNDPTIRDDFPAATAVFAGIVAAGLVVLSPPVFGRLTNTALRLIRRPPLPRVPAVRDYVTPLICSLFQWFFNGLAVWLAMRGFADDVAVTELPRVICITALVMCLSYFGALVTPSGSGRPRRRLHPPARPAHRPARSRSDGGFHAAQPHVRRDRPLHVRRRRSADDAGESPQPLTSPPAILSAAEGPRLEHACRDEVLRLAVLAQDDGGEEPRPLGVPSLPSS